MWRYLILSLFLLGCAGSGFHTSSLSLNELQSVDAYTLCRAATPRELYSPSQNVLIEVRRRGLDCSKIYTYTPDKALNTAVILAGLNLAASGTINPQTNSSNNSGKLLYSLKSSSVSGTNRICVYEQGIYSATTTINVAQTCPVIQQFSGINSGVNDIPSPQNNSNSNPQTNSSNNSGKLLYSLKSSSVSGTNRICVYAQGTYSATITINAAETCPIVKYF